jgi:hypothetical protein
MLRGAKDAAYAEALGTAKWKNFKR